MKKEEERLKQVNVRLKSARIGVTVFRKGNRLYLRATLPPKPGIDRDRPYQQELSLSIYASDEGIKQAEIEAKALGSQLAKGTFAWADWLRGTQQLPEIIDRWIARFEEDYFNRVVFWILQIAKLLKLAKKDLALVALLSARSQGLLSMSSF